MTGFLLAGVGNIDSKRKGNFLVVDSKTAQADIEVNTLLCLLPERNPILTCKKSPSQDAFRRFTNPDAKPPIGVLLLAQNVASEIRYLLDDYNQIIPAILEIPSKDSPYDPSADYLLQRVKRLTGME